MAGSGETYFSAFAVFLKATTTQIGFLASVPPLVASFAQLVSAWLGHRTGQRKRIILIGALLQALIWCPMALLPLYFRDYAVQIFIVCVTLFVPDTPMVAVSGDFSDPVASGVCSSFTAQGVTW